MNTTPKHKPHEAFETDYPWELIAGLSKKDAFFKIFEWLTPRTAVGPLGITLVHVEDDLLVLEMPITDAARQPMGLLHGGVRLLLAEEAASYHSAWGLDLTVARPVGLEASGSHLRSARDGHVQARARVVRRSSQVVVHDVQIVHVETGDLLSVVRVTNLILRIGQERTPTGG